MKNLTLAYDDIMGPGKVTFTPSNPEFRDRITNDYALVEGQRSQDLAVEAAQQFAADILQVFGIAVEYSTDPADYPPTPAPTPAEQTAAEALARYQARATAAPRVMARWAAGNDLRLAAYSPPLDPESGEPVPEPDPGDFEEPEEYQAALAAWLAIYDPDRDGWAPGLFATFMGQVAPVVVLLNSLAFGATAQAVQAFSHPLATPAAKAAYLADMAAEGALPPQQ